MVSTTGPAVLFCVPDAPQVFFRIYCDMKLFLTQKKLRNPQGIHVSMAPESCPSVRNFGNSLWIKKMNAIRRKGTAVYKLRNVLWKIWLYLYSEIYRCGQSKWRCSIIREINIHVSVSCSECGSQKKKASRQVWFNLENVFTWMVKDNFVSKPKPKQSRIWMHNLWGRINPHTIFHT